MEKAKILIVEDDAIIAMDIESRLKSLGYSVLAVMPSGKEAIIKVKESNPDLVLMDIMLHGELDGVDTADQIRTQFNIPVVYLTAEADDNLLERAKITRPFGYIIKPFEDKELHTAIEIALYKHHAENALRKAYDNLEQRVVERTQELFASNENLKTEIAKRKKNESRILFLTRLLKSNLNIDRLITREKNQDKLLHDTCKILTDIGEYRLVWIGIVEEGHKKVIPMAQAGFKEGYLESVTITWDDTHSGQGPTGTAIKTGKPSVIQDIKNDSRYEPWRKPALEHGYQSSLALPIFAGEHIYGALNIYSAQKKGFNTEELELLTNLADNIGYAIKAIDLDKKQKKTAEMLRESEAQKTAILDGITTNLAFVNENLEIQWVNKASVESVNKSPEEMIGRKCHEFWADPETPCDGCPALKAFRTKKTEQTIMHTPDGRIWDEKGTPIYDENGKMLGVLEIAHDITDKIKAEEALRESGLWMNNIFNSLEEAVMVLSPDRRLLNINESTQRMFGYSKDEIEGLSTEVFHVDREHYLEFGKRIKEAFNKGEAARFEFQAKRKDGEIFPTEHTVSLLKSDQGEQLGIVSVIRDNTEHKRTQEEIQRNYDIQKVINSLLRLSLENISLDETLKHALDLIHSIPWIAFESRGAIFLVEDDPEVLVMKAQNGLNESVQRQCSQVPFGRCICGQSASTQEIRFTDCLNHQHDILYDGISPHGHYCVPILLANRTIGIINVNLKEGHTRSQKEERFLTIVANTLSCIIMRKQAEEQILANKFMLQRVFDGISEPLLLLDKEMTVEMLNKPAAEYYKTENQVAIGKPCYQAFKERSEPCEGCNIPSAVLIGEYMSFERKDFIRPNTTENIVIYPVGKKGSEAGLAILRISDITEQRKMERELLQADKMISLGVLVSGVAHEINNPNNFIMLNAPLLWKSWKYIVPILEKHYEEKGDFNVADLPYSEMRDEIPNLFSGIEKGSKRIKQIVQDLKDFVRYEPSEMNQSVDVNKVIKNSIKLVGSLIWKSTNKFRVEYGQNLPSVKGNKQKLEQVMINLIQNACQALSDKSEGIFVASSYDAARNGIIVEVRDEGMGIPDEVLSNIMDPFFTTKRSMGGTGLGLTVSANIVREHGGRIEAKSEREIGTIFTVFLPITGIEKSAKILVVDDDDVVRMTIMQALGKERTYIMDEASNGTEACIKLGKNRPDLLIIDVIMPDMDGVEVCRLIKKDPELSGIKVVVITGYPDSSKVKEIAEMGFKNILLKPLRISDFTRMVDMVLKGEDIKSMVEFG